MIKIVSSRKLWSCDVREVIHDVIDSLESDDELTGDDALSGKQRAAVREWMQYHLQDCTVFKDLKQRNGLFVYRLIALVVIPAQILLIPFMFLKWVFTGESKLSSKGFIGRVFNNVISKAGL